MFQNLYLIFNLGSASGLRYKSRIVAMNSKGFSSLYIGVNLAILWGCHAKVNQWSFKSKMTVGNDFQEF